MTETFPNLTIWEALSHTDKAHTKDFTRGGGFRGTATKPMYLIKKMTEHFGPCGVGWGYDAPVFQTVPGAGGETAVYCTVALWHLTDGARSAPVYGIGGDFVIKQMKERLTTDDEAFKKAFTDALGNAMKHLGMSADIHMGEFDGSKYGGASERPASARSSSPPSSISQQATAARRAPASVTMAPNARDRAEAQDQPPATKQEMLDAIARSATLKALTDLTAKPRWKASIQALPVPDAVAVQNEADDKRAELAEIPLMAG